MSVIWIAGALFPVAVIGTIFLALIASERGNMALCWFWVTMVGMEVIVRLAI
jgi:hypothetical protein